MVRDMKRDLELIRVYVASIIGFFFLAYHLFKVMEEEGKTHVSYCEHFFLEKRAAGLTIRSDAIGSRAPTY